MDGYMPGCRGEGIAHDSTTYRTGESGLGGEIVDLEDYCKVVSVTGLGHGDWNQIMTKMTSGGDMYQTHIRKSRNFSIVVDFLGSSLGEIETNRKAVINLIRPDYLSGREDETRVIRYQGVDVNGKEATHPVDIKCVPLPASLVDTPDLPSYQRGVLNFAVPSGLLDGAYQEGKELDLYANFPAEFIVKRDPQGKWCRWTGTEYESIVEGMGTYIGGMEHTIMELDDGTIIAPYDITAGIPTTMLISYLDENDEWDSYVVLSGVDLIHQLVEESSIRYLLCSAPNNKFYVWGQFDGPSMSKTNALVELTKTGDTIAVTDCPWKTTTTTNEVYCGVISPDGELYIGGSFDMGGSKKNIAKWDGTSWSALSAGLNGAVRALAFAPNGILWIGGDFTNADGTYGDYLCQWDGTTFQPYWEPASDSGTELSGIVRAITFDNSGRMLAGGDYTNAGGNPKADYIARWNGSSWESFGNGVNGAVYCIAAGNREIYAAGNFTSANGMDLADKIAVYLNGAWLPLDVDLPGSGGVRTILPRNDGSLYLAGAFSTAGETPDENAKTGIVALNLEVSSASANTYPFMQIHGPGRLKAITNYSTGKTVAFDGLTLLAGEYINLWFDPLNLKFVGGWKGRGNLMRYVVPGSDYGDFYLRPGSNLISLFMTNSTSDSYAWITWTPQFWGIDGALL
jgi:hypothetical protein